MGYRYRWWYRMTGLPGWMRAGFLPGGLGYDQFGAYQGPPFLMNENTPTPWFNQYWSTYQMPFPGPAFPFPYSYNPYSAAPASSEQELDMLKGQEEILEDELEGIKLRIKEIEKKET